MTKNNKIQDILNQRSTNRHPNSTTGDTTSSQQTDPSSTDAASDAGADNTEAETGAAHHPLQTEINQLKDLLLREKAAADNLIKRHNRELADAEKYSMTKFARDIVEVLENLYRAKTHLGGNPAAAAAGKVMNPASNSGGMGNGVNSGAGGDAIADQTTAANEANTVNTAATDQTASQTIIDGLTMNIKVFEDALARHGIQRINPLGEMFNPQYHQAIAHIRRDDIPAEQVVDVVQAGYIIHDRLLRPALVAVARQG